MSKRCRHCRRSFSPKYNTTEPFCCWRCALAWSKANPEAVAKLKRAGQRAEKRAGREKLKTRRDHMREAQRSFNAFCRERDRDEPCISCGLHPQADPLRGGIWDASHYRSIGANPELRFEELNCSKACKRCNRDMSGNIVNYRIRLLAKIGANMLAWLEGPHEPKHYMAEDLIAIRKAYQVRLRDLRERREKFGAVAA